MPTEPDGTRYEGTFSDNRLQARGVTTFANGARYEGEFRDHKPTGRGVTWIDGKKLGTAQCLQVIDGVVTLSTYDQCR